VLQYYSRFVRNRNEYRMNILEQYRVELVLNIKHQVLNISISSIEPNIPAKLAVTIGLLVHYYLLAR
jgi:hypothetical protein